MCSKYKYFRLWILQFVDNFLWCTTVFNFGEVQLICFFFKGSYLENHCQIRSQDFSVELSQQPYLKIIWPLLYKFICDNRFLPLISVFPWTSAMWVWLLCIVSFGIKVWDLQLNLLKTSTFGFSDPLTLYFV